VKGLNSIKFDVSPFSQDIAREYHPSAHHSSDCSVSDPFGRGISGESESEEHVTRDPSFEFLNREHSEGSYVRSAFLQSNFPDIDMIFDANFPWNRIVRPQAVNRIS
jgi:hypothetical protein